LVFDISNKDELPIEKFREAINLVVERTNNPKIIIKLLVKNAEKVSMNEIEKIEDWGKENNLKIIKLVNPLNGD
jgi:hypothetical protein